MAESLDPRVNRVGLLELAADTHQEQPLDQWQTWEVFVQAARGEQHRHVGIVHAPNGDLALVLAKEQYSRRDKCVNIWVIKTADVVVSEYADSDMFQPATDKSYRESWGYKNREKLETFLKKQDERDMTALDDKPKPAPNSAPQAGKSKPRIIVGKRK